MNLGLEGKTAFVVGGGGGLGGAVARALASEGARVAVAGRNQQSVGRTVDTITAEAGEALAVYLDLSDLTSFDSALASVRASYGEVEILFNNSGGPPPSTAAGQPIHLWREQFEAMVMGVIALTDLVLPSMRERGWGRIVTSTSSGVVAPIPNLALSNTLRLSLVGWSKALATEVAADGITVNVVVPGRIATDRVGALDEARAKREGSTVEEIVGSAIATIPAGRYGEPDEYAAVVAFLAGERASYVTGTMVRVDGGQIPSI